MYVYPTSEEYLIEFYRSFAFAKHETIFAKILIQTLRSNFTKKRFESLIVIRSIVSSFPKNLRESFYRLKATKIFFQSLLIIGPFRLVYHPICTIGRRYIMIISHLSSLNRINVNTSTRITEPVSAVCQGRRFRGVCGGINRDYTVRRLSARTLTTFRPSRCQERARWPMRSGSSTVSDEEEQVVGSPMAQVATNMPPLRPGQGPLRPLLIAVFVFLCSLPLCRPFDLGKSQLLIAVLWTLIYSYT